MEEFWFSGLLNIEETGTFDPCVRCCGLRQLIRRFTVVSTLIEFRHAAENETSSNSDKKITKQKKKNRKSLSKNFQFNGHSNYLYSYMEAWKTVTPCLRSGKHLYISQFYKETFLTFVFDSVCNVSFSNSLIIHVALHSGQVDGLRNPMINELKTRACLQ